MKILIVDDNAGMREMMRSFLPESFDAICECEDGLAATRKIINSFPRARILMVTQYCDKELRRAANEAGAGGFFPKDDLLDLSEFFKKQQLLIRR